MHDTTVATTALLVLLAWGGVGALFFWERFLRDALRRFRRRSRLSQALVALGIAVIVAIGGIKEGNPPLRTPPPDIPSPSLTTNQCLAGFALVDADMNATFSLDAPTNAVVHTNWLLRGASRDAFAIESTDERPWSFLLGTNRLHGVWVSAGGTVSFSGPFDSATEPLPDASAPDHLAPFHATLGIVPAANWHLLPTNAPGGLWTFGLSDFGLESTGPASCFWHDTTEAGSLRLTWNNALLDRDANTPVSFQTELFPSGDFVYRYDIGGTVPTSAVIGAQNNGGGESWTNASSAQRVELFWRHFSGVGPGVADTDGDGIADYDEVFVHGTDPARADTDGDGIADGEDSAPNNADANGDGIPDGANSSAWSAHPFLAENAGFTNLVLTVVRGMVPPLRSSNASDASALLDVGGLKIPLRTGDTIPLGLPSGEDITASLRVRGNLPVQLQLSPGPNVEPFRLVDPQGIFSHGTSADASARMSFPLLSLVPLTDTGTCCLHEGDTGAEFQAILRPSGWDDALAIAEIEGFELLDGGTLWLDGPEPPSVSNTGTVTIHTPWLRWGTLSASASVHWCEAEGFYCHACGTVHTEADSCSHGANCAARFSDDEDCDCLALFVQVNSDDDNLDGTEDRFASGIVPGEDDLLAYHAVGESGCCCESFGGARVRITGISSSLRLWTVDGNALAAGGIVSNTTFLVEATAPSPAIGMGCVEYDILDGDGETIRSIARRFTMANVQIRADLDDDGSATFVDALLKSVGLGSCPSWKIPRREAPYRIAFQNETATYDGNLSLTLTGSNPLFPNLYTAARTASLFPGEATNLPPLCVRNAATTLLLDTSGASNTTAAISYSLGFDGIHTAISDVLNLHVVHVDLPDHVARSNDTANIVYDYSHVGSNIVWALYDTHSNQYLDQQNGPVYSPPENLPNGRYRVDAHYGDVFENSYSTATRSASLTVCPVELEPVIDDVDGNGFLYNPSCVVIGQTGKFKITVGDSVAIPDTDIVWSGEGVEFAYDRNYGRIVEVAPTNNGIHTLTVNISGFVGDPPQISFRALDDESEIPVQFIFIRKTNGDYPGGMASTGTFVTNTIASVNKIYRQVGIRFYPQSPTLTTRDNTLFDISDATHTSSVERIMRLTPQMDGVKIYVINSFQDNGGFLLDKAENMMAQAPSGQDVSFGIIIPFYALPRDIAHEIGHTCGLDDVLSTFSGYDKVPANPPGPITGPLVQNHVPEDWTSYYSPAVNHAEVIRRTLMNGFRTNPSSDECDIPLGTVKGYAPWDGQILPRNVGENALNRAPLSFGGNNLAP